MHNYNVSEIIDEDKNHDGGGIKFMQRPELTKLIGRKLLEDNSALPGNPIMKDGDVLHIHNLSHLSIDPHIIGHLVHLIIDGGGHHDPNFILHVVSTGMWSNKSEHEAFFDGLKEWRHIGKGISLLEGGGDGGGNGGC